MRLRPARASGPSPSSTSPSTAAPPRWPGARAGGPTPCWAGCPPITRAAPTRSRSAAPAVARPFFSPTRSPGPRGGLRGPAPGRPPPFFPPRGEAGPGGGAGRPQRRAPPPPREGPDPAPRGPWRRWAGGGGGRFGLLCCRETTRVVLPRRKLSWTKAKKLLGRANPEQRQAFIEQFQGVLAGAQRDRHLLVYVGEAHIHQDAPGRRPPLRVGRARAAAPGCLKLAGPVRPRLLLWAVSLQRGPGAALALSARQRRAHRRGSATPAHRGS